MRAMRDYGNAIKELAAINIFAGDLLFKNFGVTRYGRVVFYDYDEIEYLTDCRFRTIPPPPPGCRRDVGRSLVSGRPARHVSRGIRDVPADRSEVRHAFLAFHADLLDAQWWQAMQDSEPTTGGRSKCLSYPESIRFRRKVARPRYSIA